MYKILIIGGDGVGPEVIKPAQEILAKILSESGYPYEFKNALMGHSAILQTGQPLPQETLEMAKNSDAILFGAVGHPIYDNNPKAKIRPEQGLLKIRQKLGLFANIRPIQVFPELIEASPLKPEIVSNVDIMFFRELTGGIYFGTPRERRENGNVAIDTMIYSKEEVRRIAKMAFESARNRRKKVMSVDKANVLESSRLWREVVNEVALDFPDIQLSHQYVDSASMKLLTNPKDYDVILTENLFGDILSDEASQIAGSMGLLASASVGSNVGLFEPIHGSAPDIAGQNKANPLAMILSTALLLEIGIKLPKEAKRIIQAVEKTLKQGYRTPDIATKNTLPELILGTQEMGKKVFESL